MVDLGNSNSNLASIIEIRNSIIELRDSVVTSMLPQSNCFYPLFVRLFVCFQFILSRLVWISSY